MGLPLMSIRGFPGRRADAKRAGMIAMNLAPGESLCWT